MVVKSPGIYEVGLITWDWHFCNQSGWSFRVGEPWLEVEEYGSPRPMLGYRTVVAKGDYSIHVLATRWKIQRHGVPFVVSTDHETTIARRFAWLAGIQIKQVEIVAPGWVKSASFEHDFSLTIHPVDDEDQEYLANWFDDREGRSN
ncbi:hypothetical protein [Botrimarina mediterranea]|uniref:Uncharacterized protein n=1 Tax=Botrimarina mediterranea TaxID=2528022 RepID=A0A518KAK4_9BACT|nr:hypothetical protein [Botrimarina mediterranea]QDV74821.1 hypothetical protein Spa11_30300 [Botrimarina mediterranea]